LRDEVPVPAVVEHQYVADDDRAIDRDVVEFPVLVRAIRLDFEAVAGEFEAGLLRERPGDDPGSVGRSARKFQALNVMGQPPDFGVRSLCPIAAPATAETVCSPPGTRPTVGGAGGCADTGPPAAKPRSGTKNRMRRAM
jgi:hypothetical protein